MKSLFLFLFLVKTILIGADPFGDPIVLTNSMVIYSNIWFDGYAPSKQSVLAVYNENQLRGKSELFFNNGLASTAILVNTEIPGESLTFRLWENSYGDVFDCFANPEVFSEPGGIIGWPPEEQSFINLYTHRISEPEINFAGGIYNNHMSIELSHQVSSTQIMFFIKDLSGNIFNGIYQNPIFLEANNIYQFSAYADHEFWFKSEPIELTYILIFSPYSILAEQTGDAVKVEWLSAGFNELDGFNVYRKKLNDKGWGEKINTHIVTEHSFTDSDIEKDKSYIYAVTSVYKENESIIESVSNKISISDKTTKIFAYPNPVRKFEKLNIVFDKNFVGETIISLYDFTGRLIKVEREDFSFIGNRNTYSLNLKNKSGNDLARGSYFIKIENKHLNANYKKVIKFAIL